MELSAGAPAHIPTGLRRSGCSYSQSHQPLWLRVKLNSLGLLVVAVISVRLENVPADSLQLKRCNAVTSVWLEKCVLVVTGFSFGTSSFRIIITIHAKLLYLGTLIKAFQSTYSVVCDKYIYFSCFQLRTQS